MTDYGVPFFYCCLHVAERTVLRLTAEGFALTAYSGIPLPVWDVFWLALGHDEDRYKQAFLGLYHARIGTIMDGDEEVAAIVPEADFTLWWIVVALFILLPEAACLDGCGQSQRPAPQ